MNKNVQQAKWAMERKQKDRNLGTLRPTDFVISFPIRSLLRRARFFRHIHLCDIQLKHFPVIFRSWGDW